MPKLSPFIKQCFVTTAVCSNIIAFGSCIGLPAILLPQLREAGALIKLSTDAESWIASIFALCTLLGNVLAPPLMEQLGRRLAHVILGVIAVLGWSMIVLATNVEVLIVGRVLQGISGGILFTLRSILIGEYTSPKNRGAFLTTVSLAQAFGIFMVHLLGSLLTWQMTALIIMFFPFTSLVMTLYSPESPSWLLAKGKHEECRKVFKWLRGEDENEELEEMIQARIAFEKAINKERKLNWFRNTSEVIRKKEFYKPITLVFLGNFMMQFSGGTTMAAYSTVIIGLLMGPKANINFWMVFLDGLRIIFNTMAIFVINKVRRRVMVMSTSAICIFSYVAIAIYAYCRQNGWNYDAIWLPAVLINVQFFSVAVGMVPMPNVIAGEVFPLEYRSIGGTISMLSGGVVMFLVLKTFPALLDSLNLYGTYGLFAVVLASNLFVIYLMLPETKGKTLQQIEDEFRGRPLRLEEVASRQSLQSNPVAAYRRKMSQISSVSII